MSEKSFVVVTEKLGVVVSERARAPTVITRQERSTVITRQVCQTIQVRNDRTSVVLSSGKQGPPGVSGADGSSPDETYLAGAIVNGHRAVVRLADGRAAHYDADDLTHHGTVIGLALNAAVADGDVLVRQIGRVTFGGWGWTRGFPIFANDDGVLSHSPGPVVVQVGEATSATSIFVRVCVPIFLS